MKHITLLPILILWANLGFSQNYRPFQPNMTYAFQWSGENELFILKTDSVYTLGSDTIFTFNRIGRDSIYRGLNFSYYMKPDQDNLFGRAMIEKAGGIYEFVSSAEDTFNIQLRAPLNQAWIFNKQDSITAKITARNEMDFMGIRDSVIQIHLSNQDSLLISKNYGLIGSPAFLPLSPERSFPYRGVSGRNSDNLEIWGIEELGIGSRLPSFQELFDIEVGESFFYHERIPQYATIGTYIWQRALSAPVFPNPDSVRLKYERDRVHLTFLDVFEYLGRDTIEISQDAKNFYPHLLSNQANSDHVVLRGPFLKEPLNQQAYYVLEYFTPAIDSTNLLESTRLVLGYEKALGLTIESRYSHTQEGIGDLYSLSTMNCYEKLTDSSGVCPDTATYLALDPFLESAQLKAYPNPAKDFLEIDWEYLPSGKLELHVLDQTGRVIKHHWIDTRLQNRVSLNIETVPKGLYFLTFIWKGRKSGALKIVVHK